MTVMIATTTITSTIATIVIIALIAIIAIIITRTTTFLIITQCFLWL